MLMILNRYTVEMHLTINTMRLTMNFSIFFIGLVKFKIIWLRVIAELHYLWEGVWSM
jgi:hypothetical protein